MQRMAVIAALITVMVFCGHLRERPIRDWSFERIRDGERQH